MKKDFSGRIKDMENGFKTTEKENLEGDGGPGLQTRSERLPATEFVKVEKNLASLGFFTPSSKRLRNAQEKSFTITTVVDGQRLELKGTIIPSAKYGLPITADQDKWMALCKILTDILRKEGRVTNPVSFTSAEILRLLHIHRHSGKNYREIEEWLDVLFSTTIFSEGVVYLAREKRRVKDRFRVFERAVSFGKEMPNGKVADKNYVWFSDWQLQNINSNHLLPIDLEAYRELRNHIAKALVPLLQVWLYATRRDGVFEKRYDELCQMLNIQRYPYESWIQRTLGASLDELKHFGYLSDWRIDKTADNDNYKIVFYHGEKFHRDRRARLGRKEAAAVPSPMIAVESSSIAKQIPATVVQSPALRPMEQIVIDPQLVSEFTKRGITEAKAIQLIADRKPDQDVIAQLELTDNMIEHAGFPIKNPAGFYIRQVERNMPVPEHFETSAKRKLREEAERKARDLRAREEARQILDDEYERYCIDETDCYIAEHPDIYTPIKEAKLQEQRTWGTGFSLGSTETMASIEAKYEIRKQIPLLTFEEFVECKRRESVESSQPTSGSVAPEEVEPEDLLAAEERRDAEINMIASAAQEPMARQPTQLVVPEPIMIELVSETPEKDRETDPPVVEAA